MRSLNCKIFLVNSQSLSSAQTGKTYFVRQKLSCNSANVIYLVHCKKCNLQYVGSTTTEFKVRFRNHKSSMKTNKKTCEVAIHFNRTPHVLSDFTFQCTDQIQNSASEATEKLLIKKEATHNEASSVNVDDRRKHEAVSFIKERGRKCT